MEKKRLSGITAVGAILLLYCIPGLFIAFIVAMSRGMIEAHIRFSLIALPILLFVSAIGIFYLKEWARILTIVVLSILSLTMVLFGYKYMEILLTHPGGLTIPFAIGFLISGLVFVRIIFYLTRPKTKEQFSSSRKMFFNFLKKRRKILIIIAIVITAFLLYKLSCRLCDYFSDKAFVGSLKGEIVYTKRDDMILNIYKISANGENKQLLYHNEDAKNSNCLNPKWSKDGSKIYFSAMKEGEWKAWVMNSDGSNVKIEEGKEPALGTVRSRCDDLYVRFGSVLHLDKEGRKILVYTHKDYQPKFNVGAYNASWSPDKKFIIFSLKGFIWIASKEGTKLAKIAKGSDPDWKY